MNSAKRQKIYQTKKKAKRLALFPIPCACGCGELIPPINSIGKPSQFKLGHNSRIQNIGSRFYKGQEPWNKGKPYPRMIGNQYAKGNKHPNRPAITDETRVKMSNSHKGHPAANKGISPSPEVKAKISHTLTGQKHPPKRIKSGANHHAWQGGASTLPYGIGFTRRFKRLIRERDGNKCQRCGKTRKQHWRALEIHHIDHDKMNNDPTNLITVCGSCNVWLSHHRKEALIIFPKRKMLL